METKTIAQMLMVSGFAACLWTSQGFAAEGVHCQQVGGSVFTNFVDSTHAVGPISGDLAGAVSVEILMVKGPVYTIRKHFVTTSGDTMTVADTDFTTYPTGSGVAAATEPMIITGGTGRFDGATGSVTFFGAINGDGDVTLRYSGTICFKPSKPS